MVTKLILLFLLLLNAASAQSWSSSPHLLFQSNTSMSAYPWTSPSTGKTHILLTVGYSSGITVYYQSPDLSVAPVVIDTFPKGTSPFGSFLTGSADDKTLIAIWALVDAVPGKHQVLLKESKDGGLTWGSRAELGSINDQYARKRPTLLLLETGRVWAFYYREAADGSDQAVYSATRAPQSKTFSAEMPVFHKTKLGSNVYPVYDGKVMKLVYRKWLDKNILATEVATSASGLLWTEKEIARNDFHRYTPILYALSQKDLFVAGADVETGKTNKTLNFTYDLGKTWEADLTLVPTTMRGLSVASCRTLGGARVIPIYVREKHDVRFSYYYEAPWRQVEGQTPPEAKPEGHALAADAKILCEPGEFVAITNVQNHTSKESKLYINRAAIPEPNLEGEETALIE